MAQFIVLDINNLLAVIGGGLRLLECQDDAECRKELDEMEPLVRSFLDRSLRA